MLSDTSRRPLISASMRSSMALRLVASTSNSSPAPVTAMRRVMSPAMIERAATLIVSMRFKATRLTAKPAIRPPSVSTPSGEEIDGAHLAGEAPLLVDVAADDQLRAGADIHRHGDSEVLDIAPDIGRIAEDTARGAARRSPAAGGSGCRRASCRTDR